MKIAFLITAYREPEHLLRLVEALGHPDCRTFVHLDRKSDFAPFRPVAEHPGVTLLHKLKVSWGGWTHVEAELTLLRAALVAGDFDYFAMLSGTDYPLRSVEWLRTYLAQSGGEHIDAVPMPSVAADKPIDRLTRIHVPEGKGEKRGPIARTYVRLAKRVVRELPDRDIGKGLGGRTPHGGSTWWILSREAIETVFATIEANPRMIAFFKRGLYPDEMFFHTLVANSHLAPRVKRALTYADWSRKGENPEIIDHHHLAMFRDPDFALDDEYGRGPCFFVRKFSGEKPEVLAEFIRIRAAKDAPPKVSLRTLPYTAASQAS